MEIRNNTNLSFQAKIPQKLKSELKDQALDFGTKSLKALNNKIRDVECWGSRHSSIEVFDDLNTATSELGLANRVISSQYGASLPQKNSLFSTFMSLKENDILKAEQELENIVSKNKADLMAKAVENKALMKKITGEVNPSDEKLAMAVDSLSEEEITNLRFGLDEFSPSIGDLVNFVV